MTASEVTGYAAMALGRPLQPLTYASPDLGEHDVRVAVGQCGICFSDVQAIDDFYGITTFPFVPGHEIVGHVEARGPAVSGLHDGDRVGIGWQGRSCGRCEWCARDEEQLCQQIADMGTWESHGGFASSVTVDGRFAHPLPPAMPAETAAVLMCAGATVYSSLRQLAAEPGRKVGVHGVGGLGHLAIQFAHALGFEVTALSTSPAKEAEATAFGADHFVATGDRARMRPLDYALDAVVSTAHGDFDWEELLMTLRKRGRVVLVGFPGGTLDSTDVVAHEISISGSFLGKRSLMPEMLAFAQAHGIAPVVERLPMSRVNEAIDRLRANQARYRIVLENDVDRHA